jgi:hypothetical protein
MIQKIKNKLAIMVSMLALVTPAVAPATAVWAQQPVGPIESGLCTGSDLKLVGGECVAGADRGRFQTTLERIINIISVIVGVIAVIMIIYGGFRYITSGGKPESVKGARDTILYGIIGLIIVALAQIIVKFVLRETTSATTG